MKKILVLNGSTRRGGRTDKLSEAFIKGAEQVGHQVKNINTVDLEFHKTLYSVDQGWQNDVTLENVLTRKGLEGEYFRSFYEADVIVFSTPIYWWNIAGNLKAALDNIQDLLQAVGWDKMNKETVFLAVAGGNLYDNPIQWYKYFEYYMKWQDRGIITGADRLQEAYELGKSI